MIKLEQYHLAKEADPDSKSQLNVIALKTNPWNDFLNDYDPPEYKPPEYIFPENRLLWI